MMTVSLRLYNSLDFAYMSVYADFAVVSVFKQALSKDSWMLIFRFQLGIKYN